MKRSRAQMPRPDLSGSAHYSVEDFYRVADFCHELLNRGDAHESWLGCPFLHVVSGHPVHFANHARLLSGGGGLRLTLRERAMSSLRRGRRVARSFRGKALPAFGARDVVLVGGLVNAAHLDEDADFYFGNIQRALSERGLTSLLLLRNQTGSPSRELRARALRTGPAARALLPDVGSLSGELSLRSRAKKGALRLRRLAAEVTDDVERRLMLAAAADAGSPSTIANLALEDEVRRVCDASQPRIVFALYEGHAWERCVWRGARRASGQIKCVGYQHTIVRKHSYSMRKTMGEGANPDLVLCLGEVTRDDLAAEPELAAIGFDVLGTHRRQPRAGDASRPSREKPCLVLPEGILDEAANLFSAAAKAARLDPGRQFIFRSHPILPFEQVAMARPVLRALPPNVRISTERSLEADLRRCGWLLYRGSSTALYGILLGVRPAYLELPNEVSVDPLDRMAGGWKVTVKNGEDLVDEFSVDESLSENERDAAWRRAYAFCDRYTMVESGEAIDRLAASTAFRK